MSDLQRRATVYIRDSISAVVESVVLMRGSMSVSVSMDDMNVSPFRITVLISLLLARMFKLCC